MSKYMFTGVVGAVFLSISLAGRAADDDDLLTIVITGSRSAETVDETLAPVTVLSREQIETRQVNTVEEALAGVPGLTVSNNGGLGKLSTIHLRGTESDQVLVLVDGVKIGSATTGIAALQNIPLAQIEKIEVVRGPRSSLYGSEAIGGVIQIFTRKGREGFHPEFEVGAGSHATYKGDVGASGGNGRGWYRVNVSGIESEGFNACRGKPFPDGAGCFTYEPDDDGYRNRAVSLNGGLTVNERLTLDAHFLQSDADTEYDGSFTNESEAVQQVLGLNADVKISESWDLLLKAGRSEDDLDDFLGGEFKSRFDTTRDQFSVQTDIRTRGRGDWVVGADYLRDKVDSTTAYTVDSRDDTGLFAQYRTLLGGHDLQLSLRNDDYQDFGSETTGNLAVGHALNDYLRLTAAYGTAFRAPSFNELYYPISGNQNLDPESSQSIDLGIAGSRGAARWSVNLFRTEIDDLIAYDVSEDKVNNVDQARITGLELAASNRLGDWVLSGALTLLDVENRGRDAFRGNELPRRAATSGRIDLDRQLGKLLLGASLVGQGRSYDDLGNSRRLDGFTVVDLRAEYALSGPWTLAAKIGNVFDKDYETAAFYNQDGINGMLTVRYTPR